MKTATTIAIGLLLASQIAPCGEPNVERLAKELSELKTQVSTMEGTLRNMAKSLAAAGYCKPETEEQRDERVRVAKERRAEFEAMTIDQIEDVILDLEDQLAQAEKDEREARTAARKAGWGRRPALEANGDRQQRKAALREQFAAHRAYNEAHDRARAVGSRLHAARSVWEKKAIEPPNAEGAEKRNGE